MYENLVSITEANQNFSKVTKLVDEHGSVIILKNNKPVYEIKTFSTDEDKHQVLPKEKSDAITDIIMDKYDVAFKELAK